jgi:hypothetical protein
MLLPKNPSPEDYQRYYESLPTDKQVEFRKTGLLALINTIYTEKATDVTEDETPKSGSITSGTFWDLKGASKVGFSFTLSKSGGNFVLDYKPLKK